MTGRLKAKVALITGTGGGQGRAAALLFAKLGAKVVVANVDVEGGQQTVQTIEKAGGIQSRKRWLRLWCGYALMRPRMSPGTPCLWTAGLLHNKGIG